MSPKRRKPMTPAQRVAKQARDRAYRARKKAQAIREGRPLAEAYGHQKRLTQRKRKRAPFKRDLSNDPIGQSQGALAIYTSSSKANLRRAIQSHGAGVSVQVNVTFEAERELPSGGWSLPRPTTRKLWNGPRPMYRLRVVNPTPIGKVTVAVFSVPDYLPVSDLLATPDLWAEIAGVFEREGSA